MAIKRKKSPLFAMLFADLMMGAMGVIIVLLVFLQAVPAKGFGTEVDSSAVRLPPGLLDSKAQPMVRLRIAECNNSDEEDDSDDKENNIIVDGYKKDDNKLSYHGPVGDCDLHVHHYPTGLHGSKLQIVSKNGQKQSAETHITVSVGGYVEHHTVKGKKPPGHTLAMVAISAELIDEQ